MQHLAAALDTHQPILIPHPVAGEAFTKLRYDKRVSPRRDAGVALTVFAMISANPDVFRTVAVPASAHDRATRILADYRDHGFSYVDAVVFHIADHDSQISRVLTVDGADFRSYRFSHDVAIVTPA